MPPEEAGAIEKVWPSISTQRRIALLEDLEQLGEADDILFFDELCRIALKDELPAVAPHGDPDPAHLRGDRSDPPPFLP